MCERRELVDLLVEIQDGEVGRLRDLAYTTVGVAQGLLWEMEGRQDDKRPYLGLAFVVDELADLVEVLADKLNTIRHGLSDEPAEEADAD